MKLTEKETAVMIGFSEDCFVSDYGWENDCSSAWANCLHDSCDEAIVSKTAFPGVMASLVKKGLMTAEGVGTEAFNKLTDFGREAMQEILGEKS